MKKHHYPFANLFIKLAILLALLALLTGCGFIVMKYQSMQAEIRSLKYQPNPEMLAAAQHLERLYFGTRERIAQTLEDPVLPDSLPPVNFDSAMAAAEKQQGIARAELLSNLAEETQASVQALKDFHVAGFERAVENLRQALLQRVRELQQQFGQTPTPGATPSPGATVAAAQVDNNPEPEASTRFRLFDDNVANDRNRMRNLDQVRDFLNQLRDQSQKEESLDQIRRAQIFLTRAEAMLDQLKAVTEQTQTPALQTPETQARQTERQMVSRAEELARELEQIRRIIRQSLYETWRVDDAARQLLNLSTADLSRATAAREQTQIVRTAGLASMGQTLLLTLAVPFLILVLADFLRAFLNLSINSDSLITLPLSEAPPPAQTPAFSANQSIQAAEGEPPPASSRES